jgi:hypothetical protein
MRQRRGRSCVRSYVSKNSWGECGDAYRGCFLRKGPRGRTSRVLTRQSRRTTGRCGGERPIRYGSSEQRRCTREEGAMHW